MDALHTLSLLFVKILPAFEDQEITIRAYSDNKPVIHWVKSQNYHSNQFIQRRVEKIREVIGSENLYYVKSEENPSDIGSRSATLPTLIESKLWLHGAPWINDEILPDESVETREVQCLIALDSGDLKSTEESIINPKRNWISIIRSIAFIIRWKNDKKEGPKEKVDNPLNYENHSPFNANEIKTARKLLIKYEQNRTFGEEIQRIKEGKLVKKNHWLYKLCPLIDEDGILRVGGRLSNAPIPNNHKHPIILPKTELTFRLIEYTHRLSMHAGESKVLQMLLPEYYIPGIKSAVHKVKRNCINCKRYDARIVQPQMGQLPKVRVEPAALFQKVGVDLCGPFTIRASSLRGPKTTKAWISVFVCLSTKAVHLELLGSLSTEDFLAALTRMSSRRGGVTEIWSDNGTNFKGAAREIGEAWKKVLNDSELKTAVKEIKWTWIPRHSPTFGGLWEAQVGALKYFTNRMSSIANLHYEQFYTALCQAEAILNSRPLYANPIDPTEEMAITAFHFIAQRAYSLLPTDVKEATKSSLTKKLRNTKIIIKDFQAKYINLYLATLQKRNKWIKPTRTMMKGEVVLVKEPGVKPAWWRMGRIEELLPDKAGVVRQVKVKTSDYKTKLMAVSNLVSLTEEEESVDEDKAEPPTNPIKKADKATAKDAKTKPTSKTKQAKKKSKSPKGDQNTPQIAATSAPSTTNDQNLRRSKRTKSKITPRSVLITWLSLFNLAEALMVKQLEPGVHFYNQSRVSVKATDLVFNLKTQLNITENEQIIDTAIGRLDTECENNKRHTNMHNYCLSLVNTLLNNKRLTFTHIKRSYEKRERRALPAFIPLIMQGAKKYGATIAIGSIMAYGTYEIATEKEENKKNREKIALTEKTLKENTALLFDVQIGVEENINERMTDLITQQQLKNLESSFIANFMAIDSIISQTLKAHEDIIDIHPLEEIRKFQDKMAIPLPQVTKLQPEELLRRAKRSKILENSMVIVKMTIPIEQDIDYTEWVIVNAPDEKQNIIHLDQTNVISNIVVDNANMTMFIPDNKRGRIYENVNILTISPCLKAIMLHHPLQDVCEKDKWKIERPQTIEIGDDHGILVTGDENATIICDQHARYLNKNQIYEIEYKNCSIHSESMQWYSRLLTTANVTSQTNRTIIPINEVTNKKLALHPSTRDLRALKERTLANMEQQWLALPDSTTSASIWTIITSPVVIIIIIIGYILYRKTRNPGNEAWFPNWNGPTVAIPMPTRPTNA